MGDSEGNEGSKFIKLFILLYSLTNKRDSTKIIHPPIFVSICVGYEYCQVKNNSVRSAISIRESHQSIPEVRVNQDLKPKLLKQNLSKEALCQKEQLIRIMIFN